MQLPFQNLRRRFPLCYRFSVRFLICEFFNVLAALAITFLSNGANNLHSNLVYSVTIGTLALTFIDIMRFSIWRLSSPPVWGMLIVVVLGAVGAFGCGVKLASWLLGEPTIPWSAVYTSSNASNLSMTISISVFVVWFLTSRNRMTSLQAEAAAERERATAIEKQAIQAQLQLLQAQIEPHMLFNTLANLQGMIAIDPARAQHMLDQLITYLRATLRSSRSGQTTLGQEFSLMEAYLGLMSVRMGRRLGFTLALPPALAGTPVPPMLLQPLIENAIKHGLEPKVDGGHIRVSAEVRGPELLLCVADTGLGMEAENSASTAGTNLGVANVRERLAALFGPLATLQLSANHPQGVVALLTLPFSADHP